MAVNVYSVEKCIYLGISFDGGLALVCVRFDCLISEAEIYFLIPYLNVIA